jgi:hemolysin III
MQSPPDSDRPAATTKACGDKAGGAAFVRRFGSDDLRPGERPESTGEKLGNAISHALGFVVVLVASPFLVVHVARDRGAVAATGAAVFAVTAALLYFSSALCHAVPAGRARRFFEQLDHSAIYLLIAGTYTPFTLGVLRGPWGWSIFAAIWLLAAVGVVHKLVHGLRYPKLSLGLYLAMGWLIVVAAGPMIHRMALPGLLWLAAGGLAYTTGVLFYVAKRMPYRHLAWHLFVLLGTGCHFVAIRNHAG